MVVVLCCPWHSIYVVFIISILTSDNTLYWCILTFSDREFGMICLASEGLGGMHVLPKCALKSKKYDKLLWAFHYFQIHIKFSLSQTPRLQQKRAWLFWFSFGIIPLFYHLGSRKVKRKVPTTVVPGDHVIPTTVSYPKSSIHFIFYYFFSLPYNCSTCYGWFMFLKAWPTKFI